ncbi:AAA domain-containing protein [Durotheca rogersii]|uniref:AAA domain-containing protein n=1 Tax=Durotheca rogersii TaxID=419775 RepID=UPI00221E820D|nr:AAA domain-containing protein [Durotheca rogersii]KAI5866154.1 AAA domain-containing protein [Durotheca rogersii]
MVANAYMSNIYIVGAQCTGKTTLVNALRDHFTENAPQKRVVPEIVSEVARTVLKTHNYTADDVRSGAERCLALQELIIKAQVAAERAALEKGEWFISDRSGMDPVAYARRYVGKEEATRLTQTPGWAELKERMGKSLIVVCEPGLGWLRDDGVRLMPKDLADWTHFHDLFCGYLEEMGLEYQTLPHDIAHIADRVRYVMERWKPNIDA